MKSQRRFLILYLIENSESPQKDFLIAELNRRGLSTSVRTFERDINEMKNELGIFINYNHTSKSYEVEKNEEYVNIHQKLIRSLEQEVASNTTISEKSERSSLFAFNLIQIWDAIKAGRQIQFNYYQISGKTKREEITPYQLLEVDFNWVLVGEHSQTKKIKHYYVSGICSEIETCGNTIVSDEMVEKCNLYIRKLYPNEIPIIVNFVIRNERLKQIESSLYLYHFEILDKNETTSSVRIYNISQTDFLNILVKAEFELNVLSPKELKNGLRKKLKELVKELKN